MFENFGFARASKRIKCREARHKSLVVGQDSGDACLLQHDFCKPDAIRIAVPAPGKIAAILAIPCEQGAAQRRELARRECYSTFHNGGIVAQELKGRRRLLVKKQSAA